jgi:hypothetical protein
MKRMTTKGALTHLERETWRIERMLEVVLNPPPRGPLDLRSNGIEWEWSSFCAEVLPETWAEDPNSPMVRECMARLAVDSKLTAVAILFRFG